MTIAAQRLGARAAPPKIEVNAAQTLSVEQPVKAIVPLFHSRGIDAGGVDAAFIADRSNHVLCAWQRNQCVKGEAADEVRRDD
jgi:hypothetical protein